MGTVHKFELLTADQYLQQELHSEVRHKFVAGVTHAMVGATADRRWLGGGALRTGRPDTSAVSGSRTAGGGVI